MTHRLRFWFSSHAQMIQEKHFLLFKLIPSSWKWSIFIEIQPQLRFASNVILLWECESVQFLQLRLRLHAYVHTKVSRHIHRAFAKYSSSLSPIWQILFSCNNDCDLARMILVYFHRKIMYQYCRSFLLLILMYWYYLDDLFSILGNGGSGQHLVHLRTWTSHSETGIFEPF